MVVSRRETSVSFCATYPRIVGSTDFVGRHISASNPHIPYCHTEEQHDSVVSTSYNCVVWMVLLQS